ncbi:tetratricopeptide repeat protein [Sphingomonas tabacisoli]|uniref:Tetratricopeptide repeat protein n=1 Tax=Sphingomonas tabacisoli TaxID=2249466 RepID=A0ABW4I703_9SPHN
MLKRLTFLFLLGAATAPLAAQTAPDLNARVGKIEKELRAVQRKVFPNGQPLEPEIVAPTPTPPPAPTTSPIADLTARVDAIEAQVRGITAQAEQNDHRIAQLEDQVKQLVADAQARAAAPAPAPAAAAPSQDAAATAASAPTGIERPQTGDAAEDGYLYGFRLWQAKMYPEAETELKRVADQYPNHRRASYAQNLLGRAYLDEGKPALAAVALYDSYKKWPQGERAAESLYWLGQALTELKKPADACKVYAQFTDDYGATAAASLKAQVAAGRKRAKCA